jgi:tRNA (cmo5U34)-methyltransferase
MLDGSLAKLSQLGFLDRVDLRLGTVDDLPIDEPFDAATLIGVLHHLPGQDAKTELLQSIHARLKHGAPLVLAGNQMAYADQPLLLKAWGNRWRMNGATPDEVTAKLGRILEGAEPPASSEALLELLENAGFVEPLQFFSSLFWGAWICRKGRPGD